MKPELRRQITRSNTFAPIAEASEGSETMIKLDSKEPSRKLTL